MAMHLQHPESMQPRRHNLPGRLTSFVGRAQEQVLVASVLGHARLLTLTGIGGAGKTRLALEVAADHAGVFSDGVWLVELASVSDPQLVPQAVAHALGIAEQPGIALEDSLAAALRDAHLLLLLDNCEHVLLACAGLVARLLRDCPGLRVLATSREPMAVTGEVTLSVPPLEQPDPEALPSLEEVARTEAVQLFMERAAAALPTFTLSSANAAEIAYLCRRLDGLPLALELAAARVRHLSVEQIVARLDDRFQLLTTGARDAPARHRTLRAMVEWSYDLLTEEERALLRRLSVFAAGWTIEAAEVVGPADGVEPGAVLDLLGRLVDRSLVVADQAGRYRMLETIRRYAAERLDASGEGDATRDRLLQWCLALAERAGAALRGPRQVAWLDRLQAESDSLRAALDWLVQRGGPPEVGLRLGQVLWFFWASRGYLREGHERLLALASLPGADAYPGLRAAVLEGAGILARDRGDLATAAHLLTHALDCARAQGDPRAEASAHLQLGFLGHVQGDLDEAERRARAGLALLDGQPACWTLVLAHVLAASVRIYRGPYDAAYRSAETAAAIATQIGDPFALAYARMFAAHAALREQRIELARQHLVEALRGMHRLGEQRLSLYVVEGAGVMALVDGQPRRALRLLGAAARLRHTLGAPLAGPWRAELDRYVETARARLTPDAAEAALAEGQRLGFDDVVALALESNPRPEAHGADRPIADIGPLTWREIEVAALVTEGLTNREIAERLVLAERTVDNHVHHILGKLGLRSRTQLATWMLARGGEEPGRPRLRVV